jgi:hypothetical protein
MKHCHLLCLFASLLLFAACRREPFTDCPPESDLLEAYTIDKKDVAIYADGKAYLTKKSECSFLTQYFSPDFFTANYLIDSSGIWIRTDDGQLFPTRNRFQDDFEGYSDFLDVFATSILDTSKFWVTFTAQSPDNPEIADYVDLRKCIMDGSCVFSDNKMELIDDPDTENLGNRLIRFTAVAPKRNMVTSKMSFDSPLPYFVKGMDLWFQAEFNIQGPYPYSLVDFENPFFEGSPGPRIVIEDGALALENKFGEKLKFRQTNPVPLPQNQWFTLKVHLFLDNGNAGRMEVWQNGNQVLNVTAKNLPTFHSIQSSLEVGISATSEATTLLLDNFRISDVPF